MTMKEIIKKILENVFIACKYCIPSDQYRNQLLNVNNQYSLDITGIVKT